MAPWNLARAVIIDAGRATPIHLQIARALEVEIVTGRLAPGARLPTVREIAVTLGVATSVVQRSMAELAAQGFIMSQGSAGTYVMERHEGVATTDERMRRFARQIIEEIDRLGYDRSAIARLIDPKRTLT
jgi:GntR family transcriptional regulator